MASTNYDLYTQDAAFWEDYIKGRPQVPQSFFDRIFEYHSKHGGSFDKAHDAAAGGGIHSARLAERFKTVHVSDISEENIRVAQMRLQDNGKFTFGAARMQDATFPPDASVDMLFCAVAIHFCGVGVETAINNAARQLKPSGTLAISAFGIAVFDDPKVQDLWLRMNTQAAALTLDATKTPETSTGLYAIVQLAASEYDGVPLPEDLFLPGAQRIKMNFSPGWNWRSAMVPSVFDAVIPPLDRKGLLDILDWEENADWFFTMTPEELLAHYKSWPYKQDDQINQMWEEMQELTKDGHIKGRWPVVLLLATRK